MTQGFNNKSKHLIIKGTILALLILLIFSLSPYGPRPFGTLAPLWEELEEVDEFYVKRERWREFLTSLGPYSSAVFILFQVLQVVVSPIPGELTGALVGGYVYGKFFGFLFSVIGLALGSWVAFELARIFGRPFVERLVKREMLEKFDFVTTNIGATVCFLLFLWPGFPKDSLCYVLGLSRMGLTTFLIVSTIGRMPGIYMLAVQGASIQSLEYSTGIFFTVVAAVALFLAYLYRAQLFHWMKRE